MIHDQNPAARLLPQTNRKTVGSLYKIHTRIMGMLQMQFLINTSYMIQMIIIINMINLTVSS